MVSATGDGEEPFSQLAGKIEVSEGTEQMHENRVGSRLIHMGAGRAGANIDRRAAARATLAGPGEGETAGEDVVAVYRL